MKRRGGRGERVRPRVLQAPRPAPTLVRRWRPAWEHAELGAWTAVLVVVALVFDRSIEVEFTLPKLLWLQLGTALLAVLWAVRCWRGGDGPPPVAVGVTALALGLWWASSPWSALHLPTTLHGVHGRYNGLWTHLLLLALFAMLATSRVSAEAIERRLKALTCVLVPVAIVALVQYARLLPSWPDDRPPSTIGHPTIAGAVLGLGVPVMTSFLLGARRAVERVWWAVTLAVVTTALLATLSRGPWLGAAAGLAVLATGLALRSRHRIRLVVAVLTVCALLAALGFAAVAVDPARRAQMARRLDTLTHPFSDPAFNDRFAYYRAALAIIGDHPWTGVGFESFRLVFPRYRLASGRDAADTRTATMVHNGYLQAGVTNGLPGLVLYLAFVGTVVGLGWRAFLRARDPSRGRLALALVAAVVVYLVQDMSGWLDVPLSAFFWVILGLLSALCSADREAVLAFPKWRVAVGLTAAATVAAGSLLLAARTDRELRAEVALARCRRADVAREWPAVDAAAGRVLEQAGDNAHYLGQVATRYFERLVVAPDADVYRAGAAMLDKALMLDPFDAVVALRRVDLETLAIRRRVRPGPAPGVESALRRARDADPSSPLADESEARLRLAERRVEDARRLVARLLRARPEEGRLLLLNGDVEQAGGDPATAARAYRQAAGRLSAADRLEAQRRLAASLAQAGQFEAAASEAERVVGQVPADAVARTLLGAIYQALGRPEQALAAFEAASRLDPGDSTARLGRDAAARAVAARGPRQ